MRLEVGVTEAPVLLRAIEAMNHAASAVGEVAIHEKAKHRTRLHHLTYRMVRERFGLSAQMAIRVIGKVGGAVPYDPRILSWKGKQRERVSLLTLDGRREFRVRWSEYGRQALSRGKLRGEANLVYRDGTFYLALVVESYDSPCYEPTGGLGVDLGVVNNATDSDGAVHSSGPVEKVRVKADRLKARLQRAGTRSAHRHLQRAGRRESSFRRQTNHCISKSIVARAEGTKRAVALEDLGGIRERTTVRRSQRRRHLSWSFAQLRSSVEYNAAAKRVPVILVDPRNTSRTCPSCGTIDKKNRPTRDEFRCVSCGLAGPADRIVAGSEGTWGHGSDLSYKPPSSIGGR